MSNIAPGKIFEIVAGVYGLSVEQMSQKTFGYYRTMPQHIEARAMAIYLTFRHTQATRAAICRVLGFKVNGDGRVAVVRQATAFAELLTQNPDLCARLEHVEQQIDAVHEASEPPRPPENGREPQKVREPRIRDLPPVGEKDMTLEWWRVNDQKFRRALLLAAE